MADRQTTYPTPSPAGRDQEIDLIDYFLVIWRYRWMIAILTVVVMAATVLCMLRTPRRWKATATIVPPVEILQKEASASGGLGGLGSSMLRRVLNTGGVTGIYVEILQSREVADVLVDRFDLMNVYEGVTLRSKARSLLAGNTAINTTDEGAVKIVVTDLDPTRAAAMANAYVDELDQRNKLLSSSQSTSKRIFLESRLKEVEATLSRIDEIPAHEAEVQKTLYDWLVRECELAKIEEARSMPTIQILDAAVVPEIPVARGTVKKGITAGMAAMMLGFLLAFGREYVISAQIRRGRTGPLAAERRDDVGQPAPRRGKNDIQSVKSVRSTSAPDSAKV